MAGRPSPDPPRAAGRPSADPVESGPLGSLAPPPSDLPAEDSFYERIRRRGPVEPNREQAGVPPGEGPHGVEGWRARVALLREAAVGSLRGTLEPGHLAEAAAAGPEGRIPAPVAATEEVIRARLAARAARNATREVGAAAIDPRGRAGPRKPLA